ncbi:MAG: peptidase M50 [Chloroflexales bacterium]|nr:peptidase M50 [Chloroflexales bacterium]
MRNIFSSPNEDVFSRNTNDNFELLKAWVGTSLAFAILQSGGRVTDVGFINVLILAALTCGIGFVVHELAHRVLARRYGAEAHFVANNAWLLISIVLAFTGFFIAAPGAVWHRGYLTKQQGGLIALAGPASNFVLAVLFLLLLFTAAPLGLPGWAFQLAYLGYYINSWLGLFNLIPFGPFDGAKVLEWSQPVFAGAVVVGVLLVFVLPRTGLL